MGHPTLRLVRVAIGDLWLKELRLKEGEWRELTTGELQASKQSGKQDPQ